MIFFITALRALAACLITNAHYTGVYPTDLIANGGLIGDIIFFAVSGYCLCSCKGNFAKWYGKRVWRIYLPVVLMTAIYMILGFYSMNAEHNFVWWYLYPTYYHFIASIIVLYIPFYIIMKIPQLKKRIPLIMAIIAVVYLLVYVIFYDKSYYHIDTVREPMIRFLFMESMLLGAYFKINDEKFRNKFSWVSLVMSVVCFGGYFASKLLFSKMASISSLQVINQLIIFAFLFFVFRLFAGIDDKLEKLPKWIKKCITFISQITLEIYLVQYVIIDLLRTIAPFPINWLALTASIILAAFALHMACKGIYYLVDLCVKKIIDAWKNRKSKKEAEVVAE